MVLDLGSLSRGKAATISRGNNVPVCTHAQPHLPGEIFLTISEFLGNAETLALSISCSDLRTLLMPAMYRTVELQSNRACRLGLVMFRQHPHLCAFIRTLIVRPNSPVPSWPRLNGWMNEVQLTLLIEELSSRLNNLRKFEWGGLELPDGGMWAALRSCCPLLKTIHSTVGSKYLEPQCELFSFENLQSFSLCAHPGQRNISEMPLPSQLWEMLIERCPKLEELTLRLFHSPHSLRELDTLTSCTFPSLRAFHIEIWLSSTDPGLSSPSLPCFGKFLSAHPNLLDLSILPYANTRPSGALPLFLASTALPRLQSFVGVAEHLAELPNPASITVLDLTGDPVDETGVNSVASLLKRLVSLHTLDIRIAHPSLLVSILVAVPALSTLRIMFPCGFNTKTLNEISLALHERLPCLRSFTLYKIHHRMDASMLRSALVLFAKNPRFERVDLAWFTAARFQRKQNGSYVVVRRRGVEYLDVWERGIRTGIGGRLTQRSFQRRFQYHFEDHWWGFVRDWVRNRW
ncbi:hypothetical protein FB45DRAFT_223126 [Roridomyces roridus]|uniref:F-box domain-containing protein n=1 Tax=Roridomyces roridus TaxID=1738132 RepID=A0AAD7FD92_9AGAR|nr:hypothetical protein FB45DRAFT_223126 [Roridomyces roridus]